MATTVVWRGHVHEPGHQREGGPQEADVHRQGLEGWHDGAGLKGGTM